VDHQAIHSGSGRVICWGALTMPVPIRKVKRSATPEDTGDKQDGVQETGIGENPPKPGTDDQGSLPGGAAPKTPTGSDERSTKAKKVVKNLERLDTILIKLKTNNPNINTLPLEQKLEQARMALEDGNTSLAARFSKSIVSQIKQIKKVGKKPEKDKNAGDGGGEKEEAKTPAPPASDIPEKGDRKVAPVHKGEPDLRYTVDRLKVIKGRMDTIREQGHDVTRAEELFLETRPLMKHRDFKGALELGDRVSGMLDRIESDTTDQIGYEEPEEKAAEPTGDGLSFPSLDDDTVLDDKPEKDSPPAEKDNERSGKDRILWELEELESKMKASKEDGLETEELARTLNSGRSSLEGDDLDAAEASVEEARSLLADLDRIRQSTEEVIVVLKESKATITRAKEMGVDITEAEEVFSRAKPELENGNFDRARELGKQSRSMVEEAMRDPRRKPALDLLESVTVLIEEADRSDMDTQDAKQIVSNAMTLCEEDRFEEAEKTLKTAVGSIENTIRSGKDTIHDDTEAFLKTVESAIEEAEKDGVETEQVVTVFDDARQRLQTEDYREARDLGERALTLIEQGRKRKSVKDASSRAMDGVGMVSTEATESTTVTEEIDKSDESIVEEIPAQDATDEISDDGEEEAMGAEDEVTGYEDGNTGSMDWEAETEDGEAETEDGEAETEDGEAETEDGEAETEDGEAETEDGESETEDGEAETEDGEAETEDGESETENGDTEANLEITFEDYEKKADGAVEGMMEVKTVIEKPVPEPEKPQPPVQSTPAAPEGGAPYRGGDVFSLLSRSEEAVSEALSMGANVSEAEEFLGNAGAAYEEGRVADAKEFASRALESAKRSKEEYFISGAPIIFSSLQRSIVNLERKDGDATKAKSCLMGAKEAFEKGDFDKAMKDVQEGMQDVSIRKKDIQARKEEEARMKQEASATTPESSGDEDKEDDKDKDEPEEDQTPDDGMDGKDRQDIDPLPEIPSMPKRVEPDHHQDTEDVETLPPMEPLEDSEESDGPEGPEPSKDTIKCPQCNNDLPADSVFCSFCGGKIGK